MRTSRFWLQKRGCAGRVPVPDRHDKRTIVVLSSGAIHAEGATSEIITDALIRDVFRIETSVGHENGRPFILPQRMNVGRD